MLEHGDRMEAATSSAWCVLKRLGRLLSYLSLCSTSSILKSAVLSIRSARLSPSLSMISVLTFFAASDSNRLAYASSTLLFSSVIMRLQDIAAVGLAVLPLALVNATIMQSPWFPDDSSQDLLCPYQCLSDI